MKPFKGRINNWNFVVFSEPTEEHLGFVVRGIPSGHPEFKDFIRTSLVVKYDEATGAVETLNSRYQLLTKAEPGKEMPPKYYFGILV